MPDIREYFRGRWGAPQGYAEILRVGMPLVASMASSTVMQFTDRLFLSKYSVNAIAASMPASIASLTIMLTLMGVCGYASVLIAQYVGSGAPQRVGSALWQGIWSALLGSLVLGACWFAAVPLFDLAGHDLPVRAQEVTYFRVLTVGSGLALFGASLGGFYSGRGQTRPVMVANVAAALVNIPLDYLLIFGDQGLGALGLPPVGLPALGVLGAALATVAGWLVSMLILARLIFTREHDRLYGVLSGWRFEWDMFRRLLRYGLPSGMNFFMELVGVAWFSFEVGKFGKEALAASNIAFSLNSLVFLPMLGLNIAVSSLAGQAMGRGRPVEAELVSRHTLHLAFAYMLPTAVLIAVFAGPLMDIFAPGDMDPAAFAPIRATGITLLYFIALYSLVDAGNIVYFGALKGAGDTLGVMFLLGFALVFFLALPILVLKLFGLDSLISYWMVFTLYIMLLAVTAVIRFYRRRWHGIRVVETAPR